MMNNLNSVFKKIAAALAAGSCLSGAAVGVQAQNEDLMLEEIIVTATKRTENLQDIPVSVGVVTGEFINEIGVKDMTELQNYVPGLQVQSTFGSWAVRIRGLGSGITNLAFDSSVPVYIDGVYCGRGKCLESAFLDMERIEVARGPQGALFGKSTIAGAINAVSAKPTDELEGYVKAGFETVDGGYTLNGVISGPISDSFRGRLAVKYDDLEGFVENPFVSNDEPEEERYTVRASFAWDATEDTSINLKVETGNSETSGRANQLVGAGAMSSVSTDPNPEYKADDVRRVSTGVGVEDFYDYDFSLATLTVDTQLAEHTLTGILGYWEYDNEWFLDADGTSDFILNTGLEDEFDQTSVELRLLSPTDQTFEYIVGAWYQESDLRTRQTSPFAPLFWQAVLPPPAQAAILPVPTGMDRNFARESDAYSIYGQLTWNITDRFRAIADLRYTDEAQEGKGWSFPVTFPDNVNAVRFDGAMPSFGHNAEYLFFQDRDDDNFDPSIRFQFDLTDDAMIYAAYAEGSKAGGLKANDGNLGNIMLEKEDPAFYQRFVGQSTVTEQDMINGLTLDQGNTVFDFEEEEAESIELGAKIALAGGRANLNLALYTMTFDNLQTSSYDGTQFIIQNAASADVEGFEIEGTWQATENLRLGAAAAYVDATYDEFLGAQCIVGADNQPVTPGCEDGDEDLSGERLERVPEWEANLSANWESQLTENIRLLAMVAMYYSDEYFVRQDFSPNGRQESFTKWDARIAIAGADDRWEVGLVGRNLSDELTIQHAYEIAGDQFQNLARGRTATVEGIVRF